MTASGYASLAPGSGNPRQYLCAKVYPQPASQNIQQKRLHPLLRHRACIQDMLEAKPVTERDE